eukprot:m.130644 g.130644  ORF g.130644 m.130644 type:complete len:94 (+) comp23702_c1_seq2:77-358(+)
MFIDLIVKNQLKEARKKIKAVAVRIGIKQEEIYFVNLISGCLSLLFLSFFSIRINDLVSSFVSFFLSLLRSLTAPPSPTRSQRFSTCDKFGLR